MSAQTLQYAIPPRVSKRERWLILAVICVTLLLLVVRVRQRAAPAATPGPTPAQLTMARSDLANLRMALLLFEADNGYLPSQASVATSLMSQPSGALLWQGPYLRSVPADPWGRPYVYQPISTSSGPDVTLFSVGPDGRPGTTDDIVPRRATCGTGEYALIRIRRLRRDILVLSLNQFLTDCIAIACSLSEGDRFEAEIRWISAVQQLHILNSGAVIRCNPWSATTQPTVGYKVQHDQPSP